jgi:HEAT repeat protein
MLEGLDAVAWARLDHAYGPAADVPDLIRTLRSPDPKARDNARSQLYGNIFHQGSRYEASAYAVPFLLELLADPDTAERAEILYLLTSLAIGYDEAWLPDGFPVEDTRQGAAGGEELLRLARERGEEYVDSLDAEEQESMYVYIELAAYDAVRAGVPLFRTLLGDEDERLRTAAAYALAWFPEDGAGSTAPLAGAVADVHEPVVVCALVALGLVGTDEPVAVQPIQAALTDERDLVRWAAAVALTRLRGPAADARAVSLLLAWAGGDAEEDDEIPFLDGDLAGYAGLALEQLGEDGSGATFDALLARIPAVCGPPAIPVVGSALRRAFPDGPVADGAPFGALDPPQQRLLRVLAGSPSTWSWDGCEFANLSELLSAYDLPSTAEEMRAYAG